MNLRTITILMLVFAATICDAVPVSKGVNKKSETRSKQNTANVNRNTTIQNCNVTSVSKYKYTNYSQNYNYSGPATYQYSTVPTGGCNNCNQHNNR